MELVQRLGRESISLPARASLAFCAGAMSNERIAKTSYAEPWLLLGNHNTSAAR